MNVEKMYDELQGEICNLKRKLAESRGGGGGVITDLLYESETGLTNGTHNISFLHNVSDYDAIYAVYGNTNDPTGTPPTTSTIYAIQSGEAVHLSAYPAYGNRYFVLDADRDDDDVKLVVGSYNETIYLKIFKFYGIKF